MDVIDMADKNNYTTIRIKEDSRRKLEALKDGTDLTLSDIVENLLLNVGGTMRNDVENVHRNNTAFTLQYYDFEKEEASFRDVSYRELEKSEVRDQFSATDSPSSHSVTEFAEVIFKDDWSCFIRITELRREKTADGRQLQEHHQELVHFDIF